MTLSMTTGLPFPRGAFPTPSHLLLAAEPYTESRELRAPPPQIAYVPKKLSYWGNDRYSVCVTSEEAFTKACYEPEIFIPDDVVISWARSNGVLNGASLDEVLDWMVNKGFLVGSQRYNDGPKLLVDYSNESALQSAIAQGPVKIAIAADALPGGAGNYQGWFAIGGPRYRSTDHCVSLCGYGPAAYLYERLGVPLPSQLASNPARLGYLLFTWSTIGFIDHAWLLGTCQEAWVRDPSTVGVPPLAPPAPPPSPTPDPVPPTPTPTPTPVPPPTPTPVPQQIIVTGDLQIPIFGTPRGDITANFNGQVNVFTLQRVRGSSFKIVPKKNEPAPRPRPRPGRR